MSVFGQSGGPSVMLATSHKFHGQTASCCWSSQDIQAGGRRRHQQLHQQRASDRAGDPHLAFGAHATQQLEVLEAGGAVDGVLAGGSCGSCATGSRPSTRSCSCRSTLSLQHAACDSRFEPAGLIMLSPTLRLCKMRATKRPTCPLARLSLNTKARAYLCYKAGLDLITTQVRAWLTT